MYESVRRKRQLKIQSLPRAEASNTLSSQSRTIIFFAIFLFALAGLISGFSVGAFVRPNLLLPALSSNQSATRQIPGQSQTATHTSTTSHFVKLGWPVIPTYSALEIADSSTTYTLIAYAVDQTINSGHGNPVHASGITFKLWLVHRIPTSSTLMLDRQVLQKVASIQDPLTGTVQDTSYPEISGLSFDTSTQQTHLGNTKGKMVWKYRVSSSVAPGDYDLVVLSDWDGKYFNWSWINITIKG
jgi:hypothetical protein